MTSRKIKTFTEEHFNYFLKCILGIDSIHDTIGKYFDVDTLRQLNSLKKFKDADMLKYLSKYVLVRNCPILTKDYDAIDEKKLIVLLRNLLNHLDINIELISTVASDKKKTFYLFIKKSPILTTT
jgi:uncharacterized protein YutE (UPF0331/DUF86 family)